MSRRTAHAILLSLSLVVPATVLAGEQPTQPASEEQAKSSDTKSSAEVNEPLRFTNADLPELWPQDRVQPAEGKDAQAGRPPRKDAGESIDSALAPLQDEAREQAIIETRKEIARLEVQLEYLNSRLLAVRNPLLKRVTPPSSEEEAAVAGLPNTERVAWVTDQIAGTETALREAREQLIRLLRR